MIKRSSLQQSTELRDDTNVKILKLHQDDDGRVWLFFGEIFSHMRSAVSARFFNHKDYFGIILHYYYLEDGWAPLEKDDIRLINIDEWDEKKPGWLGSKLEREIDHMTDGLDCVHTLVKILELPMIPTKKIRILAE